MWAGSRCESHPGKNYLDGIIFRDRNGLLLKRLHRANFDYYNRTATTHIFGW
jgi:hypothetical protein